MAMASIAMLVITRGYPSQKAHEKTPFSYGFPMVFIAPDPNAPSAFFVPPHPLLSWVTGISPPGNWQKLAMDR